MKWTIPLLLIFTLHHGFASDFPTSLRAEKAIESVEEKLNDYKEHQWFSFWKNLQQGYEYFEANRQPPIVTYKNREYVIVRQ
ncbi:hypothetical protein [Glaciecola sp. 1036]|uniref:hypothetical protein n=1 Tax=Alteromonadaceae TaxID=72275 RepID=UPI003D058CA0